MPVNSFRLLRLGGTEQQHLMTPKRGIEEARQELETRCTTASITVHEVLFADGEKGFRLGFRSARDTRYVLISDPVEFLSIHFEEYVFLSGLEAICSYERGFIEASIRPLTPNFMRMRQAYRKLFGANVEGTKGVNAIDVSLESPQTGLPKIEISAASQDFKALFQRYWNAWRLTLKLYGVTIQTHDAALSLLKKTAGAIFFQIDLLSDVTFQLERHTSAFGRRQSIKKENVAAELQYPRTEFDDAPLSLYWYARSASGMPLLQFLAFYQVIEFYFTTYSQAEAHRRMKAILKDPTFRADRDSDIARLLTSVKLSRAGGLGDERSQLRATIAECIEPEALRHFLAEYPDRKEYYSKSKASPYHIIPLRNEAADLRPDVADRIYDIRCKIVHTKNDARDGDVELLLPFTAEADQLSFDIELVQFLARSVLMAGSLPFKT